MQNIKLTIQYEGTRYLGWQRPEKDKASRTVSHRVKEILHRMTGEDLLLFAGAKTDPGVHALAQTANFFTESALSPEEFCAALNRYLPRDIAVLKAEYARERFRSDLNALSRTYEYRICTRKVPDLFTAPYQDHIFPAPDLSAMKAAAAYLIGKHDLKNFTAARKKKGTVKEIFDISFSSEEDGLTIFLTANDFLSQMPSMLTETLLEAGLGQRTPESVKDLLTGTEKAGGLRSAKGLLLKSIQYPES